MFKSFIRLSAEIVLLLIADTALADNFLSPVQSSVCMEKKTGRAEDKYKIYDKAAFMAVKSSEYMQNKANTLDDHNYDLLAYKIADKALENITAATVKDDGSSICVKLMADVNEDKADKLLEAMNVVSLNPHSAQKIAQDIKSKIPQQASVSDGEIPLIYIKDIEFYNQTTSSAYTEKLADILSLEPNIFVIEDESLADYVLIPRLLKSKSDKIDEKNSRYSMSVELELRKTTGEKVGSVLKNRYIIISERKETQSTAQKLMLKLLKECLKDLGPHFKNL